ncbi:transcriptional regulator [Alloactinosynnema sp. L-07]|uniref:sporulation protein n=1 Tax=Alloactinosynnema sp. L-07 TaxID=1653480 RepID=UPI00065EFF08|nr:sporulation protein [Alloactinosynnema sp. L-07]CRK55216.1 transcriptional regulator [Alloactinosynnema sp. L-07]
MGVLDPPLSVSATHQPNLALTRLVEASGAAKKSLAFRLNQLAETAGLKTHYTHTSWTNWMKRGMRPAQAVRPLIAQVLEERLGRPVSLAEIDLDHDPGVDSSVGLEFPRELGTAVQVATRFWSQVDHRDNRVPGVAVVNYNTPVRRWLALPVDDTAASRSPAAFRRVGKADVVELLETAEQARQWDSRYGGGNWRSSQLTVCLKERAAPLLHGSYSDAVGRRLFTATAQLARLAGWTAFDNGDHATAQRHYIQALRQARAAGDVQLGGYVLTCMALQCSLGGFHDDAIDMADSAFHRVGGHATPRVKGFFKLIEARIWARSGNARMADGALATAERLLDAASSRTGDDPAWIDFFDEHRLASDAVEIHRDLGRPREAQRWNELAAMPTDTFARAYAIRQSVLGSTYLQEYQPDLEHALDHGHRAVSALAVVSSARAVDYLHALISRMSRWRTDPHVAELTRRVKSEIYAA